MSNPKRYTDEAFKASLKTSLDLLVEEHMEKCEENSPTQQLTIGAFSDRMLDVVLVFANVMLRDLMMVVSLEDSPDLGKDFLKSLSNDFEENLKNMKGMQEELAEILTRTTQQPTKH